MFIKLSATFAFSGFPDYDTAAIFAYLAYADEAPRVKYMAGESVDGLWIKPLNQVSQEGQELLRNAFTTDDVVEYIPAVTGTGDNAVPGQPGSSYFSGIEEDLETVKGMLEQIAERTTTLPKDIVSEMSECQLLQDVKASVLRIDSATDSMEKDICRHTRSMIESVDGTLTEIKDTVNVVASDNGDMKRDLTSLIQSSSQDIKAHVSGSVSELNIEEFYLLTKALTDDLRSEISVLKTTYGPTMTETKDEMKRLNVLVSGNIESWVRQAYEIATSETPFLVSMTKFLESGVLSEVVSLRTTLEEVTPTVDCVQNAVLSINSVLPVLDSIADQARAIYSVISSDLSRMDECVTNIKLMSKDLETISKVSAVNETVQTACQAIQTAKLFEKKGGL